jgi:hypothetical protein
LSLDHRSSSSGFIYHYSEDPRKPGKWQRQTAKMGSNLHSATFF